MGTIWFQDLGTIVVNGAVDLALGTRRAATDALGWLLAAVQRQRSRHDLATLDDRSLADVGLTRLDVAREIDKPFWR